jgi:hypothetical protein
VCKKPSPQLYKGCFLHRHVCGPKKNREVKPPKNFKRARDVNFSGKQFPAWCADEIYQAQPRRQRRASANRRSRRFCLCLELSSQCVCCSNLLDKAEPPLWFALLTRSLRDLNGTLRRVTPAMLLILEIGISCHINHICKIL